MLALLTGRLCEAWHRTAVPAIGQSSIADLQHNPQAGDLKVRADRDPPRAVCRHADVIRLSGNMIALEANGVRYIVNAAAVAPGRPRRPRMRFLAPFDPLVWDPRKRRRFGYYAMPLSWGEEVIGRVNCTCRAGILDIGSGYVTERDRGAGFARALDDETARLTAFLPPAGQGGESQ